MIPRGIIGLVDADRERWDQRWSDGGATRPSEVTPAPPDVIRQHDELIADLPASGRALDVACGLGSQSIWMAQRGLAVTAIDVSPVAIDTVIAAAAAHDTTLDARVVDTDDGLPDDLSELALIVCQRYRSPSFYPVFVERLAVGGVLVLTVLSAVGLDGTPGEFHAPAGELTRAFDRPDVEVLHAEELDGQASIVVRRLARE